MALSDGPPLRAVKSPAWAGASVAMRRRRGAATCFMGPTLSLTEQENRDLDQYPARFPPYPPALPDALCPRYVDGRLRWQDDDSAASRQTEEAAMPRLPIRDHAFFEQTVFEGEIGDGLLEGGRLELEGLSPLGSFRRENDPPDRFLTLLKPGVRYRPQGTMRRRSRHHLHEAHHAARHPEVPPTRRAAPVVDLLARHVEPPRDVRDHRPGLQRRHRHRQLLVHVPPAAALDPAQNLPRIDTSNPSGRP